MAKLMMSERAMRPGWRRVRFGDVVRLSTERISAPAAAGIERYVGLDHLDPGDLRVRRWGLVAEGTTFTTRFRAGQVLFGKRRAYQRKVGVPDFEGVCSGDIYVLEPNGDELLPELLPFVCQSDGFFEHAVGTSAGSLSPRTKWESVASYEFALPPLDQQAAVSVLLRRATDVVDELTEAADRCNEVKRAVLEQLLRHGLRNEPLVDTPLGPLPASWEVAPLDTHYSVQLGKMMSDTARGGEGAIPYMRNANVQWNRLDLDDVATMVFSPAEREKFSLRYGDILACEGGHVGKSAIWRDEIPGASYQKALHRVRRRNDQQLPEFLLHCLQFYHWTGRFRAVTGVTTIPHLPAERFRAMLFPFPSREEQEEIVATITAIDKTMTGIEHRRSSAARLKEELLRTALSGEAT